MTSMSRHQSHVWIDYVGDIITRLMKLPLQYLWPFFANIKNVNLHHLVQSL